MIRYTYDLDVVPNEHNGKPLVVQLNQYDTNVILEFVLFASRGEFELEEGSTAKIRGTKSDGNAISEDATLEGNVVSVAVTQQMTAAAGDNRFEIVLQSEEKELNTANFILRIERAAMDKDSITSESVVRELVNVIDRTDEIIAAAHQSDEAKERIMELEASAVEAKEISLQKAQEARDSADSAKASLDSAVETIAGREEEALTSLQDSHDAHAASLDDKLAENQLALSETYDALNERLLTDGNAMLDEAEGYKNAAAESATAAAGSASDASDTYGQVEAKATEALEALETKMQQLVTITTNSDTLSAQALQSASNAENEVEEFGTRIEEMASRLDSIDSQILTLVDDLEVDSEGQVWLLHNGERIAGPYEGFAGGGGGGGGSTVNAKFNVKNLTGWISTTIAEGDDCNVSFEWESIEDEMPTGGGTLRIMSSTGHIFEMGPIEQGVVTKNLKNYLSAGTNSIRLTIFDVYDQSRTINFTITSVGISNSSTFDPSVPYTGPIIFPYTPVGNVKKTVHFILDGEELGTTVTSVSGRQQSYVIPQQEHGMHTFECYFEAEINGQTVRSNTLYYEIICLEQMNDTPIIASSFTKEEVTQYTTINLGYMVYNPVALTTPVKIFVNDELKSEGTVDRTGQVFSYRADIPGELAIRIEAEEETREFTLAVTESDVHVEPETENLVLYLSSQGRDNTQANRNEWKYGDGEGAIEAQLSGFGFTTDGWVRDNDGIPVLRVSGDDRVVIPFKMFGKDYRDSGFTFEIEFATSAVMDYETVIFSCMSGGRGIEMTPQRIIFKSEQSELAMQFKEDEHLRIAFVGEKRSKNRLLYCYVNGIMSGVVQYPQDDDFSQKVPVDVTIGSNDCTMDLYCIRFYENDLTRIQVVDNWIADTQDVELMLARFKHNDVYNEYGAVVIDKLPSDLPYIILNCPELPQYKGDKKTISVTFVDPADPARSFTADGVQADVQGTSSQYYERKNYKLKFKNGFVMTQNGKAVSSFPIREGAVGSKVFCLKADVASSEGANNVELARLANDANPYKTPAQEENGKIRQTIDGFPIVLFWQNEDNETVFLGKANCNVDKGDLPIFGFAEDDESWEIKNNTSDRVLWKSDDYSTIITDEDGKEIPEWTQDFESRYPEDYFDASQLQELASWLKSTDQEQATGAELPSPVTYNGTQYTTDTAAYRLAKFKAELGDYMEIGSTVFYYLFSELFLMVDSRAKNAFPSFMGSQVA